MSPLEKRRWRVHKTAVHTLKAVPKKTVPKKRLRAKSCSKSACVQKLFQNASRSHGKAPSCYKNLLVTPRLRAVAKSNQASCCSAFK